MRSNVCTPKIMKMIDHKKIEIGTKKNIHKLAVRFARSESASDMKLTSPSLPQIQKIKQARNSDISQFG
jgi:hypothetical protein